MRSLLALSVIALASCADLREPAIDGAVNAVSQSDISTITVAVNHFLAERNHVSLPIFRIHVIDRNTVRVYTGERYGSRPSAGNESYIEVERIKGRWQATEKVLRW